MKFLSSFVFFFSRLLALLGLGLSLRAGAAITVVDQSWVKVAQASGDDYMHFPRALAFEVESGGVISKKILINWQTNRDVVQFPMTHGWMGSPNGAATWDTPAPTATPELDLMGAIRRLMDGTLLAIPYYPSPSVSNVTTFTFTYHTSTDNGLTWTVRSNAGTVNMGGQPINSFRFHRGIIQNSDGTLLLPAYLRFTGDTDQHNALMRSTDGGASWNFLSSISRNSGIYYNETAIVRCVNGSLLAVFRSEGNPLRYRRSTDEGLTWGAAAADLPGVPANSGVDPYLWLMPDGVLVLSYGNNVPGNMRHCTLAFSEDGNGTSWSNVTQTFTSSTTGLGNKSSGYTSVVPLSAHRFLQVSDRALYNYYGSTLHPTPNPFSIWTKTVDIVLNQSGQLDLKSRFSAGTISVTTDLTLINGTFPEARLSGAFDGSTECWSGAFKTGTSGSYTIDLQQVQNLNAVGICLQINTPQSATVELSANGAAWTTVKTYTNATHQALNYTSITATPTRYVRVTVTGNGPRVSLNEIELYAAASTITLPTQPLSQVVAAGASLTLPVAASGAAPFTYQWFKDGVAIAGATAASYSVAAASAATAGNYTVVVSNATDSITSVPATVTIGTPVPGRLANLSVRAVAGTDAQTLIVGFIIGGGSKQVLLRGLGPTLALSPFNLSGTLPDPKLQIFGSSPSLPSNENWGDGNASATLSAVFTASGAYPLDPASKDAALHTTLAGGVYTAWVTGAPGTSGVALAEIFDPEGTGAAGRLANISARAQVGTGANVLIVGFIISGNVPKQVLIRAIGPGLAGPPYNVTGVLADPKIELYPDGAKVPSVTNDNWGDNGAAGTLSAAFAATGAATLKDPASKDSALLLTLTPGSYTAVVSGVGGTTGVALVELFETP